MSMLKNFRTVGDMKRRNGGRLLVECLSGLGARKSFGVPGESYLAVLDALYDMQGTLDFVLCRNEGGAAFMAAAYGKLTGSPGICFVTRGPGATNASIGVHTAMQDSAPLLLFVGQVGRDMRDREAFQEIDYRAYFGTVAKFAKEIDAANRIPEIVSRAWTAAVSGRPGPVVIALPEDVLSEETDAAPVTKPVKVEEPAPSATTINSICASLRAARRPLILYGGGGWTPAGRSALQAFAETSDLPVLAAFRYQDLYDNHSETYVGDAGVGMLPATRALIKSADLILAINIRFGEMTTDGYQLLEVPDPVQTLIHVHVSDRELGKIYRPAIACHAGAERLCGGASKGRGFGTLGRDAGQGTARLSRLFRSACPTEPGRHGSSHGLAQGPTTGGRRSNQRRRELHRMAKQILQVWPWPGASWHRNQGAMGYGLPAAIAAKVAEPDRTVICFAGDGDFQMNCQELGTAMQAGAQPIILILNNGIYGTIRMHQERTYPGACFGDDSGESGFRDTGKGLRLSRRAGGRDRGL